MTKSRTFSVIAPFFNEEAVALVFYKYLKKALDHFKDYEIIFIDDASTDKTLKILKKIASFDSSVKLIQKRRNCGQTEAIITGLNHASGKAAIILDSDLQDPPGLIPKMIQAWERGAKIVLPQRISRSDSAFKKITARLYHLFLRLVMNINSSADFGEFYLIDRETIDVLLRYRKQKPLIRVLLQQLNFSTAIIQYRRSGRKYGRSSYSIYKMFILACQGITFARKLKAEKKEKKSVVIIGGGIGGLALAYLLAKSKKFKVTVFEKERELGGLIQATSIEGRSIEKLYHHFFTSDKYLLGLLKELRLDEQIRWLKSSVGCLKASQFNNLSSIADMIRLPFLSVWAKTRLLSGMAMAKVIPNQFLPSSLTAEKFTLRLFGHECFEKIWQPMIEGKFNSHTKNISAKWMLARLQIRTSSRSISGEKLGYLRGSFKILIDKLAKEIIKNGGEIRTVTEVKDITNQFNKVLINNKDHFDYAVITTAELSQKTVPHLGCICAIVTLKDKLTPHYWTNILDRDLPFKVMVEQTNLINPSLYNKRSVVYLSQYLEQNSKLFKSTDREIKKQYTEGLKKLFPKIKSGIIDMRIFRFANAQPIISANFVRPPNKNENIYYMTMSHIFPQDRGVNYAIKSAKSLARKLTRKH